MMERTRTYSYKVAGLTFSVIAPVGIDIEALLPSFKDFRATLREMPAPEPHRELLRLTLQAEPLEIPSDAKEVETDDNDMGHTRLLRTEDGRYCVELSGSRDGKVLGTFIANASFSSVYASIRTDAATAGSILSSMLRIAFAQAVILREGLSIHASAVVSDGKAYLFLGKSGTGKSTHARLWLKNIPGSHLLNDDNPAVRLIDGSPVAFGTPLEREDPVLPRRVRPRGRVRPPQAGRHRHIHGKRGCRRLRRTASELLRDPQRRQPTVDAIRHTHKTFGTGSGRRAHLPSGRRVRHCLS